MFKKNLWIVALFVVAAIAFMGCLEALPVDKTVIDPTANPIVPGASYLRVFNKTANSYDTLDIKTFESGLLKEVDHTITVWGKSARGTLHGFGQGLSPWSGFGGGVAADSQGMFEVTRDCVWTNELDKNIRINCPVSVPEYFIYEIVIEDNTGKIVYQMSKDPEIQEAAAGQVVIDGDNQLVWLKNSGGAKAEIVVPGSAAGEPLEGEIEIDGIFKPEFYVGSVITAKFKPDVDEGDEAFEIEKGEVTNYTFAWRGDGKVETKYDAGSGTVISTIILTEAGSYGFMVVCTKTGNFASESITVTPPLAGTLTLKGVSAFDELVTIDHDAPAGVLFVYQWATPAGNFFHTKDFVPDELGIHTLIATAVSPALFAGARTALDINVEYLVPGGAITIVADGAIKLTADITLTAEHATPGAIPGDISYQWFKNGVAIDGATDDELDIINSFGSLGKYTVVASADGYADRTSANEIEITKGPAFNVGWPGGSKPVAEADFTVDGNTFTGIDNGYRIFGSDYGDVTQFSLELEEGDLDDIVKISFTIAMPAEGGGKNYVMLASLSPIDDGLPGTVRGTAATNSRASVWSEKTIFGAGTDAGIYFGAEPDQAGVFVIVKNPGTTRPGWGAANSNAYAWDTGAHPMNLEVGGAWTQFKAAFNTAADTAGAAIPVYFAIYANTSSSDGGVIDVTGIVFDDGVPGWKAWNGTEFGIPTGVIDRSTSGNSKVWDWFAGDAPAGCIKGRLDADLVEAIRALGAEGKFKLTFSTGADGNFGSLPAGNFSALGAVTTWEVPVLNPTVGGDGTINLNTWSNPGGVVKIEILQFR